MDRNVDKKECTPEVSDGARTLENWVRGHAHYSEDSDGCAHNTSRLRP